MRVIILLRVLQSNLKQKILQAKLAVKWKIQKGGKPMQRRVS